MEFMLVHDPSHDSIKNSLCPWWK